MGPCTPGGARTGGADPFCAAAPLQPPPAAALLLQTPCPVLCSRPARFPPPAWEMLGQLRAGVLLRTEGCPLPGLWPTGDAHPRVQQLVQARPGSSPRQGAQALAHAPSGVCRSVLPLPSSSPHPWPRTSCAELRSRRGTAHAGGLPASGRACLEPPCPHAGVMALLLGSPAPSRDVCHPMVLPPLLILLSPRCTACRSCGAAHPWPPRFSCSGITATGPHASSRRSSPLSWRAG